MVARNLLIALGLGTALVAAGDGAATAQAPAAQRSAEAPDTSKDVLERAYQRSIFQSAVKRPSYRKRLVPINSGARRVTLISLTRKSDPPDQADSPFPQDKGVVQLTLLPGGAGVLERNTWVSLPSELGPKCRGATDPLLALQMLLGLPPEGGAWELFRFDVAPRHIFRPCASGPSITSRKCGFEIPTSFASASERAAIAETQAFVFQQMWSSYTKGFPWPGYPFTGMGWTYSKRC